MHSTSGCSKNKNCLQSSWIFVLSFTFTMGQPFRTIYSLLSCKKYKEKEMFIDDQPITTTTKSKIIRKCERRHICCSFYFISSSSLYLLLSFIIIFISVRLYLSFFLSLSFILSVKKKKNKIQLTSRLEAVRRISI